MNTQTKRFNWRVSEHTAAELAYRMRTAGFRSWDEFFRDLLARSGTIREAKDSDPVEKLEEKMGLLCQKMDERKEDIRIQGMDAKLETLEQDLQVIREEQKEFLESIRRWMEMLGWTSEAHQHHLPWRKSLVELSEREREAHEKLQRIIDRRSV